MALAGCQTDELAKTGRAMQPLSRDMQALLEKKNMSVESPILVRIFKEELELEVWKKDAYGQFALLKTYPICRWSGDLGPKVKQGDRQAPEGFYTITPGQMNPNSQYYLAFNLGFPNAFDRAYDRSGAFLMVHGDCSSAGCYSMSDEQMAEIYALGREAFLGGQKSFQVQAFPFRMTAVNLAKHRTNPHLAFWRMIKEGNDHFEVTRQEPRVDVCDKRYVFNATAVSGAFNPRGSCPSYRVPEQIAAAVKEKREQDEQQFADLVSRGIQTVAVNSGSDGGMHPAFVAKLQPHALIDTTGRPAAYTQPGSGLPTLVRLPRAIDMEGGRPVLTQVASADSTQSIVAVQSSEQSSGNFFTRLFSSGSQTSDTGNKDAAKKDSPKKDPAKKDAAKKATASAQAKSAASITAAATDRSTSSRSSSDAKTSTAKDESKRKVASAGTSAKSENRDTPSSASAFAGGAAAGGSQPMSGAQPVVPGSSFDSRFGGWR